MIQIIIKLKLKYKNVRAILNKKYRVTSWY